MPRIEIVTGKRHTQNRDTQAFHCPKWGTKLSVLCKYLTLQINKGWIRQTQKVKRSGSATYWLYGLVKVT